MESESTITAKLFLRRTYDHDYLVNHLARLSYNALMGLTALIPQDFFDPDELDRSEKYALKNPHRASRADQIGLMARVLVSIEEYNRFLGVLPSDLARTLDLLMYEPSVTLEELSEVYGIHLTVHKPHKKSRRQQRYGYHYYYASQEKVAGYLGEEYRIFLHSGTSIYYKEAHGIPDYGTPVGDPAEHRLELSPALRRILVGYYQPPEETTIKPADPETLTALRLYRGETAALNALRIARLTAENISTNKDGLPSRRRPELRQLAELYGLTDSIFSPGMHPMTNELMPHLVAAFAVEMRSLPREEPVERTVRAWFQKRVDPAQYSKPPLPFAALLLPYLTVLGNRAWGEYPAEPIAQFLQLVGSGAPGTWIEVEGLIEQMLFYHPPEQLLPCTLNSSVRANKSVDSHAGNQLTHEERVVRPFLKGLFFVLATYGLVDIVYDTEVEKKVTLFRDQDSFYDGLYAFRLTTLGAYAAGQTDDYVPTDLETLTFTPDPDLLLLRVEGKDLLAQQLLNGYCVRLAEGRYQLDAANFLQNTKDRTTFTDRVARFRKVIGQEELPPNWERWFRETAERFSALHPVENVRIFKIEAVNRTLKELLTRDATLRKLHLRAEDHQILVRERDYERFAARLLELGYVL